MTTCLLTNISFSCKQKQMVMDLLLEKQPTLPRVKIKKIVKEFCFPCFFQPNVNVTFQFYHASIFSSQTSTKYKSEFSIIICFHWSWRNQFGFRIHWERKELTFKKIKSLQEGRKCISSNRYGKCIMVENCFWRSIISIFKNFHLLCKLYHMASIFKFFYFVFNLSSNYNRPCDF